MERCVWPNNGLRISGERKRVRWMRVLGRVTTGFAAPRRSEVYEV